MTDQLEVLDHIERSSPPWQRDRLTECGRLITDVKSVVSRAAIKAKVEKLGKQRSAFSTCMTCLERSHPFQTWEQSPGSVVSRYVERSRYVTYGRQDDDTRGQRIAMELYALGHLVENHREEFEQTIEDISQTTSLADERLKRARKRA
jgi:hypothetical protein